MSYCQLCGGELEPLGDHQKCTQCSQQYYFNPKPCVEIALLNRRGQLLLSKRAKQPFKGKYDLPGGFIDGGENAEEALKREIKEELDLEWSQIKDVEYFTSYSADYPWGNDTYKNLILTFCGRCDLEEITAHDDVEEVRWFDAKDIVPEMLSVNKLSGILGQLIEYNKKRGN